MQGKIQIWQDFSGAPKSLCIKGNVSVSLIHHSPHARPYKMVTCYGRLMSLSDY